MWVRHKDLLELVRRDWCQPTDAVGLLNLQTKLARVKKVLHRWNKETFGDLHANLRMVEVKVTAGQSTFETDPSPGNRANINKAIAEYILLLKMEEDFWRQKATLRWLSDGDRNTKFYQRWDRNTKFYQRNTKIPTYCLDCKHVGHTMSNCYANGKRERPAKRNYNFPPPTHQNKGPLERNGECSKSGPQIGKNNGNNKGESSLTLHGRAEEKSGGGSKGTLEEFPDIMGNPNEETITTHDLRAAGRTKTRNGIPSRLEMGFKDEAWLGKEGGDTEKHMALTGANNDPGGRSQRSKTLGHQNLLWTLHKEPY